MNKLILVCLFLLTTCQLFASPAPPQLSVTTSGTDVSVAWNEVPDASGYRFYYTPYPYQGAASIEQINVGELTGASFSLWPNAGFIVAVTAYNEQGESLYSNPEVILIVPQDTPEQSAPQLSLTTSGQNVSVSWDQVPSAGGYTLYYAPYPFTEADFIGSADVGMTTNVSFDLPAGTAYYLAVNASTPTGDSGLSNVELFVLGETVYEWQDKDSDGHAFDQGDCNDDDSSISPEATEICGDLIDQNCDGIDESCSADGNPVIPAGQTIRYNENQLANNIIGTIVASDDLGIADFQFTVTHSHLSADGYYQLDTNGQVSITDAGAAAGVSNNDFEVLPNTFNYNLTVFDTDNNSSEQSVQLAVDNLDEVAPVITSTATATPIAEGSGAGQKVYTVTADDSGDISEGINFSLGGTDTDAFTIDSSTGEVTLISDPDFEDQNEYTFVVTATDMAGHQDEIGVSLEIIDLPETGPPSVQTVAIDGATGMMNSYLNGGDVITAAVTMTNIVHVTGTPQLQLTIGSKSVWADYIAGSGTTRLLFNYTILHQAGVQDPSLRENDSDGISISANSLVLNGGTIMDNESNPANLAHAAVADNAAYMVDTIPPQAGSLPGFYEISNDTGISDSDFITNVAEQTVTKGMYGALAEGDYVIGSLDEGATWINITDKVNGNSVVWDGVILSSEYNSIMIKFEDIAGNISTSSRLLYTLDTTAPQTGILIGTVDISNDTGVSDSDHITKIASQTITGSMWGTLVQGDFLFGSLDEGATWIDITDKVSGNSIIWDVVTLSTDYDSVMMKVVDVAGNSSGDYWLLYTLDTTPPQVGIIPASIDISDDSGSSNSDNITNVANQTLTGTITQPLVQGEYLFGTLDGGSNWLDITSKVSDTSINWDGITLTDNGFIIIKIEDAAGNSSGEIHLNYTLDTTAPEAYVTPGSIDISVDSGISDDDFLTNVANQTVAATLAAPLAYGETLYGSVNAGLSWAIITHKVSGTTINWDGVTLSGSSQIMLKVEDTAGNSSGITSASYEIDKTAPGITLSSVVDDVGPITGPLTSGDKTDDPSLVISGSCETGSTVAVYDGNSLLGQATVSGKDWSYALATADGVTYQLNVKAADQAGNISNATANFEVKAVLF